MGTIFTLTPDIKNIAQAAIDDLMAPEHSGGLGKECRLVYPPRFTACSNCIFDIVGQKSSNRWITGGPFEFANGGICPICSGEGKLAEEVTETVYMLVASKPSDFYIKYPGEINVSRGTIQTKGFKKDLHKIIQAQEMILQPSSFPIKLRYKLMGEPVDIGNIIQGRYFVAIWERAG